MQKWRETPLKLEGDEMSKTPSILSPTGDKLVRALPKAKAVHPFGSKILVEVLRADEIMGSSIHLNESVQLDGAPQAYIMELGPTVPADCGLKVGQRIYWTGRGTEINNPACTTSRVNAMLEISNILGIIDEQ